MKSSARIPRTIKPAILLGFVVLLFVSILSQRFVNMNGDLMIVEVEKQEISGHVSPEVFMLDLAKNVLKALVPAL
jgi:hypothetical protein